jgi:RNA polymerase sigma-70 factor, ECF subfamily
LRERNRSLDERILRWRLTPYRGSLQGCRRLLCFEGQVIPAFGDDIRELLHACADSNDFCAWQQFVARFERAITLSVIRTAKQWGEAPDEIAADLVQETYLRLCDGRFHLLRSFALNHPHAVEGYVKTVAANVTHDFCKARRSSKNGSASVDQIHDSFEPPASLDSFGGEVDMERAVLLSEIEKGLDACTEGPMRDRDRTLFWLYYRLGMSASAIASMPSMGLTVKGVESAILRLTRQVRAYIATSESSAERQTSQSVRGFRAAKSF